jgi:hypothetical protein
MAFTVYIFIMWKIWDRWEEEAIVCMVVMIRLELI